MTAAYFFFPLFIAIYAGKIADQVGDRLPILLGMIGVGLGMSLPILFTALYVSQVIVGISHVFVLLSLQNVLGNWAPPEKAQTRKNSGYFFTLNHTVIYIAILVLISSYFLCYCFL